MRGDHRRFTGKSPHAALQQRVVLPRPVLTRNKAEDGTRRQRVCTATSELRTTPRRHGKDSAREVERSFPRRRIVCHDRALGVACDPVRSVGRSVARCRHYRHAGRSGAARIIAGVLITAQPSGLGINVTVSTSCEDSQDHEERVSQSRT
jgi:hypothetical protein